MSRADSERWMMLAIDLAREALLSGEVPIGALVLFPDGLYTRGKNRMREISPLHHAEMEAIRGAEAAKGSRALESAVIYCTSEPCIMCLGALVHARVGGLVYGCEEPRFGGVNALRNLWKEGRYPHRFPITGGVCRDLAKELLQQFFAGLRAGDGPTPG